MASAVVFAYHNVGVRCLSVLIAHGIDIRLVITHQDNPSENIWFGSVKELSESYEIPVIMPDNPNSPEMITRLKDCQADFLFSFYYRNMLSKAVLETAKRGAFNMHGSLLPKYRGRVPVNWAIIHGEVETGATLHVMNEKPDNGAIVDQFAVPILPDDRSAEVFNKVTVAAELVMNRCLPDLVKGNAQFTPQDLSKGAYFGGRKAEDGRINWQQPAHAIHNLVRAVSEPFPGAFFDTPQGQIILWQTHVTNLSETGKPALFFKNNALYARCADGQLLRVLKAELNGQPLNADNFNYRFDGAHIIMLPT
jgi:methionyl-tRNA formyltransferase